ncbi:hypothetical protein HY628_01675 [Candidatus Uhrbacteria bacterium]|nr:hypothetical protein [Candidatus Uhrbacteria bacterium]
MKFLLAISRWVLMGSVLFSPALAKALTVSPPLMEMEVDPGQVIQRSVRVYNETSEPLVIRFEINALAFDEARGVPIPSLSSEDASAEWLSWMDSVAPITLAPGVWQDVPLTVRAPSTAEPGTKGMLVLLTSLKPESAGMVNILGKTGVAVTVTVSGEVREAGKIVDFRVSGMKTSRTSWFDSQPKQFVAQLQNQGSVSVIPSGTLTVRNWWGRQTLWLALNTPERRLLPGWRRTIEIGKEESGANAFLREWKSFGFGPYRAEITARLGSLVLQKEIRYWVIPWRTLTGISALVIVIFCAFYLRKRRL